MLSAIGGSIISAIAGSLFDKVAATFQAYFDKEISREEAQAKVSVALAESFAEVETAHADALAKTWSAFMATAQKSLLVRVVWAVVTLSQLAVLLWHQVGIPAYVAITGDGYPSSGTTVEWAYLLLAAALGLGPVIMRSGPGAGDLQERLKRLAGR